MTDPDSSFPPVPHIRMPCVLYFTQHWRLNVSPLYCILHPHRHQCALVPPPAAHTTRTPRLPKAMPPLCGTLLAPFWVNDIPILPKGGLRVHVVRQLGRQCNLLCYLLLTPTFLLNHIGFQCARPLLQSVRSFPLQPSQRTYLS